MKLAEDFPFYADLVAPPHRERIFDGAEKPGAGEIAVDDSWAICKESAGAPVDVAAEELAEFFDGAMGLRLPAAEAPRKERVISLRVDPALAGDETHRVRVEGTRVEITGGGPRGVLHGAFRLEDLLCRRRAPFVPRELDETRKPLFTNRIHRSCASPFYAEETTGFSDFPYRQPEEGTIVTAYRHEDAGVDAFYHDRILLGLARHGFNGIWLRGCLRLMSRVEAFGEFGADADRILSRLEGLGRRAARFGIGLFLYMQEPLGFFDDDPFWDAHPECRGTLDESSGVRALCTSVPRVRAFLREGTRYVFERVPSLKGLILITASEFQCHCYSRVSTFGPCANFGELLEARRMCPRCASRVPQEVIAEVVSLMRDGAAEARGDALIIAWNWGWQMHEEDPQAGVMERLPADVIVMGSYEIGEPTRALDLEYVNEEYSIRIAGPSERFRGLADFQRSRGRSVYAKLQLGTSHEDPTVPYLPLMHKVARKYQTLRETGVTGLMTCWNFGNMPSRVTELAGLFSWDPQPEDAEAELLALAARDFGEAAQAVTAAWRAFSRAWEDFPGSIPLMYFGPLGRGPAWHFHLEKIDRGNTYSWFILDRVNGDSLDWTEHPTEPFDAEVVIRCMEAQLAGWRRGLELLASAPSPIHPDQKRKLELERNLARVIGFQIATTIRVARFLVARNRFYEETDPARKEKLLDELGSILEDERADCLECLPLVDADPRLGFHGEAYGYMFNRKLIEEKLASLDETLKVKLPALRA